MLLQIINKTVTIHKVVLHDYCLMDNQEECSGDNNNFLEKKLKRSRGQSAPMIYDSVSIISSLNMLDLPYGNTT